MNFREHADTPQLVFKHTLHTYIHSNNIKTYHNIYYCHHRTPLKPVTLHIVYDMLFEINVKIKPNVYYFVDILIFAKCSCCSQLHNMSLLTEPLSMIFNFPYYYSLYGVSEYVIKCCYLNKKLYVGVKHVSVYS